MNELILASGSPRRQELLRQLGLEFKVLVSDVEEDIKKDVPPDQLAENLALLKARDVASNLKSGLIIGADTIVVNSGKVLGKPTDAVEARKMLRELSGSKHQVITGVALIAKATNSEVIFHETTKVNFRNLAEEEIENYVSSGEPLDKAGAYAIQGIGAVMVKGIEGCYFNVVGLPLARVAEELKKLGVKVL